MNFERKWCHECNGIQLFGEHKGKACCSIMSRILKDSETGEPIRAYMDKGTTRNMCRNLGEGCPILETLGSRSMTVSEITDELVKAGRIPYYNRNYVAPRLSELKDMGVVETCGRRHKKRRTKPWKELEKRSHLSQIWP